MYLKTKTLSTSSLLLVVFSMTLFLFGENKIALNVAFLSWITSFTSLFTYHLSKTNFEIGLLRKDLFYCLFNALFLPTSVFLVAYAIFQVSLSLERDIGLGFVMYSLAFNELFRFRREQQEEKELFDQKPQ